MEFPAVRRTEPITIGQISSTPHVQLIQCLHGKQQQRIRLRRDHNMNRTAVVTREVNDIN